MLSRIRIRFRSVVNVTAGAILLALVVSTLLTAQQVDIYSRPKQVERSRTFDALHYRISLTFNLEQKTFEGENLITLTPLNDGFRLCELDVEELIVDGVHDESDALLQFQQSEKKISIEFPRAFDRGDTVRFAVVYHAEDPQYGLFFDEEGTDRPRMVSTDSWPDETHHWVPCYDYPNDKVTHDLIVTVEEGDKVLSNGRFKGVIHDADAGTSTWHWSQDLPHSTYLMMLAVGPFEVIQDSLGSLPINYWVYPKDVENARWIFEKTPRMIRFFNDIFKYEYPWAKYDQVTTPHVGGGAEATSATVLGHGVIHDRRAEQDFSWERIIAHEASHQWWGDLITLREWSHTWLNESFGTYSDYLWTRHEKGEDEGSWDLMGKKNQYLREAHTRYMRPIVFDRYDRPSDNFDSHTYPKGACVLHMLRFIMGDGPFFQTLSYFLHEHAFQPVDTHDFMVAVKDVTGMNLDWFFEQFLFKPGHPVFQVSYKWNEAEEKLRLRIIQLQDTSKDIPIYRIPVQIGIITSTGRTTEKIWLSEIDEVFELPVLVKPLMVRFDEGNYLLKEWTFEKSCEELLFQLVNDDVIGRAWAVTELQRYVNDPAAIEGLIERAIKDEFWAVRVQAVEALGRIGKEDHIDLLRDICTDENSKVRTATLKVLGSTGDRTLVPLFQERFQSEDSYLAQAEALRGIGRCGDSTQLRFLRRAAETTSPRDVIRRAAEWAIEEIGKRSF